MYIVIDNLSIRTINLSTIFVLLDFKTQLYSGSYFE